MKCGSCRSTLQGMDPFMMEIERRRVDDGGCFVDGEIHIQKPILVSRCSENYTIGVHVLPGNRGGRMYLQSIDKCVSIAPSICALCTRSVIICVDETRYVGLPYSIYVFGIRSFRDVFPCRGSLTRLASMDDQRGPHSVCVLLQVRTCSYLLSNMLRNT